MGQQQLLLIILGVIVVGIAVAVGITMFTDNAISANRDAVSNDLVNLAARAQQYYRRPTSLGGGGGQFTGLTADQPGFAKLSNIPWGSNSANLQTGGNNANGCYTISAAGTQTTLQLQGIGTEKIGTQYVTMQMYVFPDRDSLVLIY